VAASAGEMLPTMVGRSPTAPPISSPAETAPSGGLAGLSVVLVEPSRTQAGIVRKYLQQIGVERIETTGAGQEALALARQSHAGVLLSAMHLSDMTGIRLSQALRAEPGGQAVGFVLLTSQADAGETNALPADPRTVLLYKPFDLPRLAEALARAAGRDVPALTTQVGHRPTEHLRVLIADDSAAARAHIRAVLRGLGFNHFSEVSDGAAAVESLAREKFDLVVTDFNMPRLDGAELTRHIRQASTVPAVPVLVVTTETDPAIHEKLRQAGASAICAKSFKPEAVRALLTPLL
jgi:two-component system chemotaxis response regulator CheY